MSLSRKRNGSVARTLFMILILLAAAAGTASFFLFLEGKKPTIDLSSLPEYLGRTDQLKITARDAGNGIRSITVSASQDGQAQELFFEELPRKGYIGQIGPAELTKTIPFDASKLGFTDGEVTINVSVSDFSLRGFLAGNSTTSFKTAKLDTKPPRIQILHSERYISPGGTGVVIYRNSEPDGNHGVGINGRFNPGFPVPDGRKNTFIAYFGMPYDAETLDESFIDARDKAGNRATIPFTVTVKKAIQKQDRINVGDGFLNRKIPEFEQYYPDLQGSMLDKYLTSNRDIRIANNNKIDTLCSNPSDEQYWEGRFIRMAGSSRAGFADHRTYYYQGEAIDKQVHLGMDIASTKRADVKAANSGMVVYADYLGIYGYMVLLDHGQGVFSLYSHLSQINVSVEDMVAKGDILGLTGTSGMAGGDHLHFSMLINGVFVTPKEWWDPNWVEVTVNQPLTDSKF